MYQLFFVIVNKVRLAHNSYQINNDKKKKYFYNVKYGL